MLLKRKGCGQFLKGERERSRDRKRLRVIERATETQKKIAINISLFPGYTHGLLKHWLGEYTVFLTPLSPAISVSFFCSLSAGL